MRSRFAALLPECTMQRRGPSCPQQLLQNKLGSIWPLLSACLCSAAPPLPSCSFFFFLRSELYCVSSARESAAVLTRSQLTHNFSSNSPSSSCHTQPVSTSALTLPLTRSKQWAGLSGCHADVPTFPAAVTYSDVPENGSIVRRGRKKKLYCSLCQQVQPIMHNNDIHTEQNTQGVSLCIHRYALRSPFQVGSTLRTGQRWA